MGFSVQPAALNELAALLDRAREDAGKAKTYLAKMENFEGGVGVINVCLPGHQDAYRELSNWLTEVADPTLSGTSGAVAASATYYQNTDAASAGKLDATYPPTNVPGLREYPGYVPIESEGTARFADCIDPGEHLTGPHDYGNELYGNTFDWWDVTSPLAIIGMSIQRVSEIAVWLGWLDKPYHPMKELAEKFVGDWAGARQAADILRNVGRSMNSVGLNVQWGSQGIEAVWQGNAADGATGYLMALARRFDPPNTYFPIDTLAKQYEAASADMVNLRDAAVNILNSIFDAVLEACVAAGIGGGAAATGVGAPVAALAALYAGHKIARVVDAIADLNSVVGDLATATSTLKAVQGGFAGPGRIAMPNMPTAPIDVPK
jgi:hypothetical protein